MLAAVSLLLAASASAQDFALKDGDRVVFYGDSITQDGRYAQTVEAYVGTRFPQWKVTFVNAGVGGDKVSGGSSGPIETRLERDVIVHRPTVVTVMLGMNDGGYRAYDAALFEAFSQGYRKIVTHLKEALPGVRLTLILPSPYDDVTRAPGFPDGYNGVLRRYGAFVQDLAREQGASAVDLNAPVVAGLEKVSRTNAVLARQLIPDRVHPGGAAHLVMAAALLRAWNAPSLVSQVDLDGKASRLVRAENTDVAALADKGPYLEWKQTDRALPMALSFKDAEVELAQMAGANLDGLDQQVLKIAGLGAGRYEVLVDGGVVGKYSEVELAAGVNLALQETPMTRQAMPFLWNAGERQELQHVRRRLLVAGQGEPRMVGAAEVLGGLDAKQQEERPAAAGPSPHRFEVRRPYSLR
jgi:lysophospholipase L1-like esterase